MFFKENLIFIMKKRKLSAPMLSNLSGVPKTTINSIKGINSKNPTLDTAYKLTFALGISLDDMVTKDLSKENEY